MNILYIVAWQYRINRLPGLLVDVYRVYRHFSELGFQIRYITNAGNEVIPEEALSHITSGDLDTGLFDFSEYLNKVVVEDVVEELSKQVPATIQDRVVVYFTGHGELGSLLTPDGFKVDNNVLLKLCSGGNNTLLLDCCHPLCLDFSLDNESWNFRTLGKCKNSILCITACRSEDKSLAGTIGSLFTTDFFRYLNNQREGPWASLSTMIETIRKNCGQRVVASCTIPGVPVIPSYLYSKMVIEFNVRGWITLTTT